MSRRSRCAVLLGALFALFHSLAPCPAQLILAPLPITASATATPNPATVGSNITYTITIANSGESRAGFSMTAQLSPDTTYVSAQANVATRHSGLTVVASGVVPAGGTSNVTIVARVNSGLAAGTEIDFSGMVNKNIPVSVAVNATRATIAQCAPNMQAVADEGLCTATVNPGSAVGNAATVSVTGVRSDGKALTDPYPGGKTTIQWTATDAGGNTATCSQIITVVDTQSPVITCPADVTTPADPGQCSAAHVRVGVATATDNCGKTLFSVRRSDGKALHDPYPVGTTLVTWRTADIAGNLATCTQTVKVVDAEAPVINCADLVVNADSGLCRWTPDGPLTPNVTDNCGIGSSVGVRSDGKALGDSYPVGTTRVTWTVMDTSGNTSSCTQNVIVKDAGAPVITCPPTIQATADPRLCSVLLPNGPGVATATDNCGVVSVSGARSDGKDLVKDAYPVGQTVITWTATDAGGNQSTCSQTVKIVVTDNQQPWLICPADVTVTVPVGTCSTTVTTGQPTILDNCRGAHPVAVRSDDPSKKLIDPFPVGMTTVTWTAVDQAGNKATCIQKITVKQAPVIKCPPDIIRNNDPGKCGTAIIGQPAAVSANCQGTAWVTGARSDGGAVQGFYPIGTTLVTWTTTLAGDTATCVQKVTVQDKQPPVLTCPADIRASTDAGKCTATVTVRTPAAWDICGAPSVQGVRSDGMALTDPYPTGTTTITWTAASTGGATTTCIQKVIVAETAPPVLTVAANVTANADPGQCSRSFAPIQATAWDSCPGVTVQGLRSDGLPLSSPYPIGVTLIAWTARNAGGVAASGTQQILIVDNQAPVVNAPADITVNHDPGLTSAVVNIGQAHPTDNCGRYTLTVTRADGRRLTDPYPVGATLVTYRVADTAGNVSIAVQKINVLGPFKPTITCPANVQASTDAGVCTATVNPGTPTVTSSNPLGTPTAVRSDGQALTAPYPKGATQIVWTVQDAAGNSASCTQTVTVSDRQPPTIACPAGLVVAAQSTSGAAVSLTKPTGSDNCSGWTVTGARSDGQSMGALFPVGTTTVTWTVTDTSGLSASCQQAVDVSPLVVACAPDVATTIQAGQCQGIQVTVGQPTVTGLYNYQVTSARSDGKAVTDPYLPGDTTITWTAQDVNGNTATCVQTIHVTGTATSTTCPADIATVTVPGQCYGNVFLTGPGVTGCGAVVSSTNAGVKAGVSTAFAVGTTVVQWVVTDSSGNVSTCSQKISVSTGAVTVAPPADVTAQASPATCSAIVNVGVAVGVDGYCHELITVTGARSDGKALSDPYPVGTTTIVWTGMDSIGRTATAVQHVVVTAASGTCGP